MSIAGELDESPLRDTSDRNNSVILQGCKIPENAVPSAATSRPGAFLWNKSIFLLLQSFILCELSSFLCKARTDGGRELWSCLPSACRHDDALSPHQLRSPLHLFGVHSALYLDRAWCYAFNHSPFHIQGQTLSHGRFSRAAPSPTGFWVADPLRLWKGWIGLCQPPLVWFLKLVFPCLSSITWSLIYFVMSWSDLVGSVLPGHSGGKQRRSGAFGSFTQCWRVTPAAQVRPASARVFPGVGWKGEATSCYRADALLRNFQRCWEVLTHSMQARAPAEAGLRGGLRAFGWRQQKMLL